jgi:hypothetical protein
MKHFTRFVCLVLALAMCLGLTGLVSAAGYSAFPDANKVSYPESMDVLTNLGIIAGANGYLKPGDPVTREQAAKMIAYICLGAAAEKLTASKSTFEDVAANRWSAGFIGYCAEKGIIAGVGDTNHNGKAEFQPTANVTGNQFVKMLLGAVGYGVNKEFEGSSWAVNTKSYGDKVGAFESTKATNLDAAATREEAMLYAFNVMTKAMTVSYSSASKSYYSGSSASAVIAPADEYRYTLGYKVYGLYRQQTSADSLGRLQFQWKISGGKTVSDAYLLPATKTYTTAVSSGTLYTDLTSAYAGKATYILNGTEQKAKFLIEKNGDATVGGTGVRTRVYVDPTDKSVTIVSIVAYLGIIDTVNGKNSSVTVYYGPGKSENLTYNAADFDSFKKGAYVIVALADGSVQSLVAAQSVDGVLDTSAETYLKIGSTTYNKSFAYGGVEFAVSDSDYTSTYTFFLDPFGNVLGDVPSDSSSSAGGYIYVTASEYASTLLTKQANIEVQHPNGDTEVLSLAIWKNGEKYYYANPTGGTTEITSSNGQALNDLAVPGFYRYTEASGAVTLKSVSSSNQYAAGWTDTLLEVKKDSKALYLDGKTVLKTANFGSSAPALSLTSSTVLNVVNANGEVTTFAGYNKIAGYVSDKTADVLVVYNGSDIDTIYVFGSDYITTSANYALYTGSHIIVKGVDNYTFYVDGKSVNYALDYSSLGSKLVGSSLYTVTLTDGAVTAVTPVMAAKDTVTVSSVASRSFTVGKTTYDFADNCPIYSAKDGSKTALAKNDQIVFALDKYSDVACIYIIG